MAIPRNGAESNLMSLSKLKVTATAYSFTLRLIQGYRYLDRCGEALCRIEKTMDDGWIVGDVAPKGGAIRNYKLGMAAQFGPDRISVTQKEFLSPDHFINEVAKLVAILQGEFGIERAKVPTLKVTYQHGCRDADEAEAILLQMGVIPVRDDLLNAIDGKKAAVTQVVVTSDRRDWEGTSVLQRRRVEMRCVRQEVQPEFDQRILQRAVLLGMREREAMKMLRRLRDHHAPPNLAAIEFDIENSFEDPEFLAERLPVHSFMSESFGWTERMREYFQSYEKA